MNSSSLENQRVGVFVDVQNIYFSAKRSVNSYSRPNLENILRVAVSNRQLIRAFAYLVKTDENDIDAFKEYLVRLGYDVKFKKQKKFIDGNTKADWDVGIAIDIMRLATKLDTIVLVSGDGDFTELLTYVKSLGCRIEVMAFGKSTSAELIEESDNYIDLGQDPLRYVL